MLEQRSGCKVTESAPTTEDTAMIIRNTNKKTLMAHMYRVDHDGPPFFFACILCKAFLLSMANLVKPPRTDTKLLVSLSAKFTQNQISNACLQ